VVEGDAAKDADPRDSLAEGVSQRRRGEVVRFQHQGCMPGLGCLTGGLDGRDRVGRPLEDADHVGAVVTVEVDRAFDLQCAHGPTA
jgi:hypothetical protein